MKLLGGSEVGAAQRASGAERRTSASRRGGGWERRGERQGRSGGRERDERRRRNRGQRRWGGSEFLFPTVRGGVGAADRIRTRAACCTEGQRRGWEGGRWRIVGRKSSLSNLFKPFHYLVPNR